MHDATAGDVTVRSSEICELVSRNAAKRRQVLSLVASENVMSPAALYAGGSDLNHRYTIPPTGERPPEIWEYPGQELQREIERKTRVLAQDLFAAEYGDVRPLSGNNAVFAVISALTNHGDTVMRVAPEHGGHFATGPIAQALQLQLVDIPFDRSRCAVDIPKLKAAYDRCTPALVLFDASMVLFPTPIREIREALGDNAVISYDGSHTLGMIAGGVFANPLTAGADLLHGSTHKSLFGPQKGMILCRKQGTVAERIAETVVPLFASNVHTHHVAALGVALEELQLFGREYASQVVKNARSLAAALEAGGMEVCNRERQYTECHQIWTVRGTADEAIRSFQALERVGVLANPIRIPFRESFGLRIGLSELTRRGLTEEGVQEVGSIILEALGLEPDEPSLSRRVQDLAGRLGELRFALPASGSHCGE